MDFDRQYENYVNLIEGAIDQQIQEWTARIEDPTLLKAMSYSLTAGGKRIRPVLVLATCSALGGDVQKALPYALAIEQVHTYSLIHDDLPAMDNDDFRRGKPSNHKVFGEAMAILAGDALLNAAYENAICHIDGESCKKAAGILADSAGYYGMVSGQATDMTTDVKTKSADLLATIHSLKTGKLLTASVLIGGAIAGANCDSALTSFGESFGRLFQITDDVLDVVGNKNSLGKSTGKDQEQNKLTAVSLWGLEAAQNVAKEEYEKAVESIAFLGDNGAFLAELARRVFVRIFA